MTEGSVQKHYKDHLAAIYSWMKGDFESQVIEQQRLLEDMGVAKTSKGTALDLGAGPGYQSAALKRMGYETVAVDTSEQLLAELEERVSGVRVHVGDIRDLGFLSHLTFDVVVCMGDTLTHLSSLDEVTRNFQWVYSHLQSEGTAVYTFRELRLAENELDRVILVRADEQRILTCLLSDLGEKVRVFDLVHVKHENTWQLQKSFYDKIRIDAAWAEAELRRIGYQDVKLELRKGMISLVARRS